MKHILPQLVGHVGWKRDDETCIHEAADGSVGDLNLVSAHFDGLMLALTIIPGEVHGRHQETERESEHTPGHCEVLHSCSNLAKCLLLRCFYTVLS